MKNDEDRPLTVSEAARELTLMVDEDVAPKVLSDLLYRRVLDEGRCPIIGGRRVIPAAYLAEVARVLRVRGYVRGAAAA